MHHPFPEDWTVDDIETNGVRLRYVRAGGPGQSLVVAHGFYDNAACRLPLLRELASTYDVVAYDARGHGQSAAPDTGYTVPDRVDDLVGLLDELRLDSPALLGHSIGGNTVLAAAARHPERPAAVVAIDPAGLLDIESDPAIRERHAREQIEEWHAHTAEELLTEDESLRAYVEADEERLARLLAHARQQVHPNAAAVTHHGCALPKEIYPEITASTLVLRADGDEEQRTRDQQRCETLPAGRLVHVDGAGHTVVRDAREEATAEITGFLSSHLP